MDHLQGAIPTPTLQMYVAIYLRNNISAFLLFCVSTYTYFSNKFAITSINVKLYVTPFHHTCFTNT